jgi:hypothetical protein
LEALRAHLVDQLPVTEAAAAQGYSRAAGGGEQLSNEDRFGGRPRDQASHAAAGEPGRGQPVGQSAVFAVGGEVDERSRPTGNPNSASSRSPPVRC